MKSVRAECQCPYDILIESGILRRTGEILRPILKAEKLLLVTDRNVDKLYADVVLTSLKKTFGNRKVFKFVLPSGEQSKTVFNYLDIVSSLAKHELTRSDAVVALGGGVVGDMAGFAAATYMRGIDYVQMPTTLLAMIDSSVGSKTGVDLPEGKNLLGAFHTPRVVLIDPDALETLSEDEYENGLGEGVKYAVMDPEITPYLFENRKDVVSFIKKCVALKADIVRRDEREGGLRRLLNLGHTVGHAIEADSDFTVRHGIAVAKGISVMTSAALTAGEISLGRAEEIFEMLKLVGVGRIDVDADALSPFIALDKKSEGEAINAVVVTGSGAEVRKMTKDEFLRYIANTDILVKRSRICGRARVPASKSLAHRVMIAAYLAGGSVEVEGGDDIEATKSCLEQLRVSRQKGVEAILDVGESGSTLRFLLPIVCAQGGDALIFCKGRLKDRPIEGLLDVLAAHGAEFLRMDVNPLNVMKCKLRAGDYVVDGSVSSQYVTGLLMALPLLEGDSTLTVVGKAASASYVKLTLDVLKRFSIDIKSCGGVYKIKGGQRYKAPRDIAVEGDWSSACALLVAGALAGEVRVEGLDPDSEQGDRVVVELLTSAGADIKFEDGAYVARKSKLSAIDFDAANCPDLVPIMATALSFAEGVSRITSVDRLRFKESDRLEAVRTLLESFGVKTEYGADTLAIYGNAQHKAGEYPTFNDHRMAMSAIVAALATEGECVIRDAKCVKKSYPNFVSVLRDMGADISKEGK